MKSAHAPALLRATALRRAGARCARPGRSVVGACAVALASAAPAWAQAPASPGGGPQNNARPPAARAVTAPAPRTVVRSESLPARGLFEGDRLSAAAQERIAALIAGAADLELQFAFVAPTGAWKTEGSDERSLTPARLQALRDFLASRGVDSRRIYVESRIDPRAADAQLRIEIAGRPAM